MNITEFMSFDLEWFTTVPGLLITGGVIVLLIALIIFIISNKKSEKKVTEEGQSNNANVGVTPEVNVMSAAMPVNEPVVLSMDTPVMPEANVATMDFANPVIQNGYVAAPVVATPAVEPVVENPVNDNVFRATSFNNMVAPVEEPVAPATDVNNVVPNNVIDFTQPSSMQNSEPVIPAAPVQESVASVLEVPVAPVVEPVIPAASVVNEPQSYVAPAAPVVEEKPMIYGGVSPVNTFTSNEPVSKPVIYGGADPLENTTTLPRMNNHEAYSATPSVAPVVETPVVNEPQPYVAPSAPVFEQTPVAAPVTQPVMPMTGAEMFATTDTNENNGSSSSSSDIETLEF